MRFSLCLGITNGVITNVIGKESHMRLRMLGYVSLPALLVGLLCMPGLARQEKGEAKGDTEGIQNLAKAFIKAFESGDAKAVAAIWAEDGTYTNLGGEELKGRDAIEKAF